jgi:AraC family transcriptional regulator
MAKHGITFERVTAQYTIRIVRYAPHRYMARHAHDDHGISVVLDGELVEEAEHRSVTATPGWVVNKPRGLFHANRFGGRGATLLAIHPAAAMAEMAPSQWSWRNSATALQAGLRLLREPKPETPGNPSTDDEIADLLGALVDVPPRARQRPWLARVKQALDESTGDSVARLAGEAAVHPVYLARAFRAAYGMSIREYRRTVQVRRAAHLVTTTRFPLTQIALDCGFADHSHMCRAFRFLGLSPSALRR